MARTREPNELRRNDRVMLLVDLPGAKAGSKGKVYLLNGLDWLRYRVLFDDGTDIGSIDGSMLIRLDRAGAPVA